MYRTTFVNSMIQMGRNAKKRKSKKARPLVRDALVKQTPHDRLSSQPGVPTRLGWVGYVRVHGVTPQSGLADKLFTANISGVEGVGDIRVELMVDTRVTLPLSFDPPTAVHVIGQPAPAPRMGETLREDDPVGSWIRVSVSKEYAVSASTEQSSAVGGSPTTDSNSEFWRLVGEDFERIGPFLAWYAVRDFAANYPHLRRTGLIVWQGDASAPSIKVDARLRSIPPGTITAGDLVSVVNRLARVVPPNIPESSIRPLAVAAHWLLTGSAQPEGSIERFTTHYLALEAICKARTIDVSAARTRARDRLDEIVGDLPNDAAKEELISYLKAAKERLGEPPMLQRFRELAERLSPGTAEADLRAFKHLKDVRNSILHGDITVVPSHFKSTPVESTLRELCVRYLQLVLDDVSADARCEVVAVNDERGASQT